MFKPKTVFVIGAGASSEVGLPIGRGLAREIGKLLYFEFDIGLKTGNPIYLDALREFCRATSTDLTSYLSVCRQMSEGMPTSESIDNYIDRHREDGKVAFCGKLAIAQTILAAERASNLLSNFDRNQETLRFENLETTWYSVFQSILTEGVPKSSLNRLFENISVISFNYDRCLAFYLRFAIARAYAVSLREAHELVGQLRIYYPYGSLGLLADNGTGGFGVNAQRSQLVSIAGGLKTYSEESEAASLNDMRSWISDADIIVFLGFHFHRQNMRLLIETPPSRLPHVYATAYQFSDSNKQAVEETLLQKLVATNTSHDVRRRRVVVRNDLKAAELLRDYRLSLSIQ